MWHNGIRIQFGWSSGVTFMFICCFRFYWWFLLFSVALHPCQYLLPAWSLYILLTACSIFTWASATTLSSSWIDFFFWGRGGVSTKFTFGTRAYRANTAVWGDVEYNREGNCHIVMAFRRFDVSLPTYALKNNTKTGNQLVHTKSTVPLFRL